MMCIIRNVEKKIDNNCKRNSTSYKSHRIVRILQEARIASNIMDHLKKQINTKIVFNFY